MHTQSKTERLDRARIIGLSAAIALNAVAVFLLSMPGGLPAASGIFAPEQTPLVTWIELRSAPPTPSAPAVPVEPRPATHRIAAPSKQPVMSAAAVLPTPLIDGDAIAGPTLGGTDGTGTATGVGSGPMVTGMGTGTGRGDGAPPHDAKLKSIKAPEPPYPSFAALHGIEGRVILRVFVDANGRVTSVVIALSSGHPELDDAARREVLKTWTFEPEIRHGKPIAADGIVVVNFKQTRA